MKCFTCPNQTEDGSKWCDACRDKHEMTPDLPPTVSTLAKTHPTLWANMSEGAKAVYVMSIAKGTPGCMIGSGQVQRDTVDKAEHEHLRAFYTLRMNLLQEQLKNLREPERTIVCDILANGSLLPLPSRYKSDDEVQP